MIKLIKFLSPALSILALTACGVSERQPAPDASDPQHIDLSQYRPQSLYHTKGTQVGKAHYPAIDMHSHAYPESEAEIGEWVKRMDELGIEKTVVLTKATGAAFDSLYALYSQWDGRFEVWCGFDYSGYNQPGFGPEAVEELERCFKAGATGIGELGDKGAGLVYSGPVSAKGMHIDDPRMDPLLEKAGELGMPVNIHVAEPIWMYQSMDSTNDGLMNAYNWRLDNKEGIKSQTEMIRTLEKAVKKHPNTTFIAAHLGNSSYNLELVGELFDSYPNLYADVAARYAELSQIPRHAADFITEWQDRIVYGTDMGTDTAMYRTTFKILETGDEHFYRHDQFGYHWSLNGFHLDDAVLKKIYKTNAQKLLNR